jgi:NAD(P)-dependent dehydrogenase (short-subunit alcohol dehydrogenase family)
MDESADWSERSTMSKTILVTKTTDALGAGIAQALADAGHHVYAGVDPPGKPSPAAPEDVQPYPGRLLGTPLDLGDQRSVTAGVNEVMSRAGRIDVVVHTTTYLPFGPVESFSPYQLSQMYDLSVLTVQRVNRAVLPFMRSGGGGLIVWVGHSTGGQPAGTLCLGAGLEALADRISDGYASDLARFAIEVCRVAVSIDDVAAHHLVLPDDVATTAAYRDRRAAPEGSADGEGWEKTVRAGGRAVARLIDTPAGERPRYVPATP